jgi:hypothetical protein
MRARCRIGIPLLLWLVFFNVGSAVASDLKNRVSLALTPLEILNAGDTDATGGVEDRLMFGQRGSVSWNESNFINYLGFRVAREYQYSQTRRSPAIHFYGLSAGHQFRFRKGFLYMPVSLGASVNNGVRRGKFLGDTCIRCSPPTDGSLYISHFERKSFFISPGLFIESTPSLLIGRFFLGIPVSWNYNVAVKSPGAGLTVGWIFAEPRALGR